MVVPMNPMNHKYSVLHMSSLTIQTVILYSTGKVMDHDLATRNYMNKNENVSSLPSALSTV